MLIRRPDLKLRFFKIPGYMKIIPFDILTKNQYFKIYINSGKL